MGAVSTLAGVRRRNLPGLGRYLAALGGRGEPPPREVECLDDDTCARERLLLGLRLDEPLPVAALDGALDLAAAERLAARGLVRLDGGAGRARTVTLTPRGRYLGGGVTAELMQYGA